MVSCGIRFLTVAALFGLASNVQIASAQTPAPKSDAPDLTIGAEQDPSDDAIILRWEQSWTVHPDGSLTRRDHKWIKLLNTRPIRRAADPRIDFHSGEDGVVIHTAQAHLPDGTTLPVPDYGYNIGAARDVAGWPEYVPWKQHIVSFSGVQPGATLELDYEITTKAGVLPWASADVRLDDDYPIVERIIQVSVPVGQELSFVFENAKGIERSKRQATTDSANTLQTHSWRLGPMSGTPAEPQAPQWRERCPRLLWSTASASSWTEATLHAVEESARIDARITAFAQEAIEGKLDAAEKADAIATQLHDRFNFVNSPKTYRSRTCRKASDVLSVHYGSPLEAGAVLLSALRAAGLSARPAVAVDEKAWHSSAPTEAAFAGIVVVVDNQGSPLYVHPQKGIVDNPGAWGGHVLLNVNPQGDVHEQTIQRRGEENPSRLLVSGRITAATDKTAQGELRIRLTGVFFDPQELETADAQKQFIEALTRRIVNDFAVDGFSIQTLSRKELVAAIAISSDGKMTEHGGYFGFRLADKPAFLADVPLPLKRSYRSLPVQLASRFTEEIELNIEYPKKWSVEAMPEAIESTSGDSGSGVWGTVTQVVERVEKPDDGVLRFRRRIELRSDTISPESFSAVRAAVNDLCAIRSRGFLWGE